MNDLPEVSPRDYHKKLLLDRSNLLSPGSWLSKSSLWELREASLWRWRYHPKEFTPTDATDWGSVVDCLVTTPDELEFVVAEHDYAAFRCEESKQFRNEARESGLIPFHVDKLKQARIAANRIQAHPEAGPVVQDAAKQVVLLNQLKGFRFKGLADFVPDSPCLYDLKTTGRLNPKAMSNTVADRGYHVQAQIYLKLWNLCYPDDVRKRFRLIWQENKPPYEVAVTEMTADDLILGEEWASHQLRRLAKAAESNHWPSIFNDQVVMLSRPTYAAYEDEEEFEGPMSAPTLATQEDAA